MSDWQTIKGQGLPTANHCAFRRLWDSANRIWPQEFLRLTFACWVAVAGGGGAWAQQPEEINARAVAAEFEARKQIIAGAVSATLRTNTLKASYTTVWRNYEDAAIDAVRIANVVEHGMDVLSEGSLRCIEFSD